MLLRPCTIVLLVLASLPVNAASVTSVIIANEAVSSSAVNVAAVDQVHTTNRSGLTDLGSVSGAQNQMEVDVPLSNGGKWLMLKEIGYFYALNVATKNMYIYNKSTYIELLMLYIRAH